jgi:CheY-like chemotaxis protein
MEQQQTEGQQPQTILVVESDEATRRILDLSLRHAGFAVRVAANAEEGDKRLADRPDLVIVAADDPDGLAFCKRAKQSDAPAPAPAVVLVLEPNVESKRRGIEAGADDFVARPIYVQEVVARSRALLQRRDRERLELSAQDNQRFVGNIEDVPLVDLVRAIAANQKSGVALVIGGEGARGELFFRQGRVVDAEVGRLSGRNAVFRLFCWSSGRLAVEWKSIRRKDTIETPPHELLMEALRRVDEWRRLLAGVPALDTIFEVDYRLLAERLADIPDEVNRILRLFDGVRTFLQVIDDCGLPDLDAVAAVSKLYREHIIHDVRQPVEDEETLTADMEGWLSDATGPFRAQPRQERDLFGAGPEAGVGVHGRITAPLDPLGDGARDPLDDDMRLRFTNRLEAEAAPLESPDGAPIAIPPSPAPVPELPLEALIDPGPAGNGTRPSTLPGMGTATADASRGTVDVSRGTIEMQVPEEHPANATLPGRPEPPPAPAQPRRRTTDSGHPRSASGEIHVQKALVRAAQSMPTSSLPLVHVQHGSEEAVPPPIARLREDSGREFVRPTMVTPPGSARALDEPPPLADKPALSPTAERVERAKALAIRRGTPAGVAQRIPVSDADADDDIDIPSRGRRVLGVVAGAVVLVGVVVVLASRSGRSRDARHDEQAAQQTAPAAPSATQPTIVPLDSAPAGKPQQNALTVGGDAQGARKGMPTQAVVREELDERSADPRMARERAAEARPLLAVCRTAFQERRMRDAEATCTAARDANPDSADAYTLLAHALFNRNRRRDALAAAERAVKINPRTADAYVIIGGVRQDEGDTEEARRAYQRYLDLDPKGQYAADLRAIVGRLPAKL